MRVANPASRLRRNSLRVRRGTPLSLVRLPQTPSVPAGWPLLARFHCAPDPRLAPADGTATPRPSRAPSASAPALPRTTPRRVSTASYFLRPRAQNPFDHFRHAVPFFGFALQPALSRRGQVVVLRFPLVVRLAPLAPDPALILQAVQCRIERALLDFQPVLRNLLDTQQNSVSVQWPERDGFQDQHVERSLQKLQLPVHRALLLDGLGI